MDLARWQAVAITLATAAAALAAPGHPVVPFAVGVAPLAASRRGDEGELGGGLSTTWSFTRPILPPLLAGILVADLLLGRPGHAGPIPAGRVAAAVGGNSLALPLFASIAGAFLSFAPRTRMPILQGLLGSGMGQGPALPLLPALARRHGGSVLARVAQTGEARQFARRCDARPADEGQLAADRAGPCPEEPLAGPDLSLCHPSDVEEALRVGIVSTRSTVGEASARAKRSVSSEMRTLRPVAVPVSVNGPLVVELLEVRLAAGAARRDQEAVEKAARRMPFAGLGDDAQLLVLSALGSQGLHGGQTGAHCERHGGALVAEEGHSRSYELTGALHDGLLCLRGSWGGADLDARPRPPAAASGSVAVATRICFGPGTGLAS